MRCKKHDGTYTVTAWRYYYPQCPRLSTTCNGKAGAWVAAVTVCGQRLF